MVQIMVAVCRMENVLESKVRIPRDNKVAMSKRAEFSSERGQCIVRWFAKVLLL